MIYIDLTWRANWRWLIVRILMVLGIVGAPVAIHWLATR